MFKRPLMLVMLAFVLGEVCAKNNALVAIVLAGILLIGLMISWIKGLCQFRRWLFVLPFFIILGSIAVVNQQYQMKKNDLSKERAVKLSGSISELSAGTYGLVATIDQVKIAYFGEVTPFYGKILVYGIEDTRMKIGQGILLEGTLADFELPGNPGQFDAKKYYHAKGIYGRLDADKMTIWRKEYFHYGEALRALRNRIAELYDAMLSPKDAGIVKAMVIGEKSGMDAEVKRLYQENGIAHILAISGLHISLVAGSLFHILRKRGVGYLSAGILAGIFLLSYSFLTGLGGATVRAMIMLLLALIGQVLGRTYDLLTSMSVAAILMLAENPLRLYDAGFLLSFGAIAGIGMVYPAMKRSFPTKKKWIDGFLVSISIQIGTIPVLIYFYYELAVYSVFLNMLVIPLMSILLFFAITGAVFGTVSLFWGKILMLPVVVILQIYHVLCTLFEKLPASQLVTGMPSGIRIFLYYGIAAAALIAGMKRYQKECMILLILAVACIAWKDEQGLLIVYADVGQGDGIFIRADKSTYLIDGGSSDVKKVGEYRLYPLMKYYGEGSLDYAIVTHADSDHISGILELLKRIKIRYLLLPDIEEPDESYEALQKLAKERNTKIFYLKKGDQFGGKQLRFQCLHPFSGRTYADRNQYSTVLRLTYKNFSGLFTGDLPEEEEAGILNELRRCTVLKIAHHGSRFSTTKTFLEKVRPSTAVISCGKRNRYGHPHKELMDRLNVYSIDIMRTDQDGAVILWTDGERITIKRGTST